MCLSVSRELVYYRLMEEQKYYIIYLAHKGYFLAVHTRHLPCTCGVYKVNCLTCYTPTLLHHCTKLFFTVPSIFINNTPYMCISGYGHMGSAIPLQYKVHCSRLVLEDVSTLTIGFSNHNSTSDNNKDNSSNNIKNNTPNIHRVVHKSLKKNY